MLELFSFSFSLSSCDVEWDRTTIWMKYVVVRRNIVEDVLKSQVKQRAKLKQQQQFQQQQ